MVVHCPVTDYPDSVLLVSGMKLKDRVVLGSVSVKAVLVIQSPGLIMFALFTELLVRIANLVVS